MNQVRTEIRMKTSYSHLEDNRLAVIDLIDYTDIVSHEFPDTQKVYVVSRVNTPPAIRGRSIARKLLRQMIDDADSTTTVLILDPRPYPGTEMARLVRLYLQFGFEMQKDGSMMRLPKAVNPAHILSAS